MRPPTPTHPRPAPFTSLRAPAPARPSLSILASPSIHLPPPNLQSRTRLNQPMDVKDFFFMTTLLFQKTFWAIFLPQTFYFIFILFFANLALSVKTEWSFTTSRRRTAVIVINYAGLRGINEIRTVCLIKLMHGHTHVRGAGPGIYGCPWSIWPHM